MAHRHAGPVGALLALITLAFGRAALGHGALEAGALTPTIIVHLAKVVPAIALGACLFLARQGTRRHRWPGRLWCLLMTVTAAVSLGIRDMHGGPLSFIHIFSVVTLVGVLWAVISVRRGDMTSHARALKGCSSARS